VREFARLNPPQALLGEGDHSAEPNGRWAASAPADAETGMAEMSKRFADGGAELYVPAGD
jgi:hypothetical protein